MWKIAGGVVLGGILLFVIVISAGVFTEIHEDYQGCGSYDALMTAYANVPDKDPVRVKEYCRQYNQVLAEQERKGQEEPRRQEDAQWEDYKAINPLPVVRLSTDGRDKTE